MNTNNELNFEEFECVGILPGLENTIDVMYARIDDLKPVLHIKLHSISHSFNEVGYRRLDGGALPKNLDSLESFLKDAYVQAAAITERMLDWAKADRAQKATIN